MFWILPLRGWASGLLSANKETADGLCVETFVSPGAGPGQNSSVIILRIWIKPLLSACRHITLWLRCCFGIYSPVGYCKAWFLGPLQLLCWYCTVFYHWGKTCMVLWRDVEHLDTVHRWKITTVPQIFSQQTWMIAQFIFQRIERFFFNLYAVVCCYAYMLFSQNHIQMAFFIS